MRAVIIILILLSSCTPQERLNRLIKKHPELAKTDSLYFRDTIYIKSVQHDSTFFYNQKDTVIIREGRLTMKYFYNTHDSTVYLNGKCDTIVRIIEKQIPYNKFDVVIEAKKYKWYLIGLLALIVLGVIYKLFK